MSLAHARVLIFAAPLYEDLELWYPKIRLEEEGATVVVAGLGEKTYQGKRGYPVALDTSVDRIRTFSGAMSRCSGSRARSSRRASRWPSSATRVGYRSRRGSSGAGAAPASAPSGTTWSTPGWSGRTAPWWWTGT
jgi:hypothetical protein